MTIQLPQELEAVLTAKATAQGLTAESYLRELLERELAQSVEPKAANKPFKSSYGLLAQYGPAPTDEEMDQNRREMFQSLSKDF